MVTAGIFMVARMSPLYELSTTALVVLVISAITALFTGLPRHYQVTSSVSGLFYVVATKFL